jgi:hypothetical protein
MAPTIRARRRVPLTTAAPALTAFPLEPLPVTDERAARYSRAGVLSTLPREGTPDGYRGGEQDRLRRSGMTHQAMRSSVHHSS